MGFADLRKLNLNSAVKKAKEQLDYNSDIPQGLGIGSTSYILKWGEVGGGWIELKNKELFKSWFKNQSTPHLLPHSSQPHDFLFPTLATELSSQERAEWVDAGSEKTLQLRVRVS